LILLIQQAAEDLKTMVEKITNRRVSETIDYIIDITEIARTTKEEIPIPDKNNNWSSSEIFHQNISRLRKRLT
jgi:cyclase